MVVIFLAKLKSKNCSYLYSLYFREIYISIFKRLTCEISFHKLLFKISQYCRTPLPCFSLLGHQFVYTFCICCHKLIEYIVYFYVCMHAYRRHSHTYTKYLFPVSDIYLLPYFKIKWFPDHQSESLDTSLIIYVTYISLSSH